MSDPAKDLEHLERLRSLERRVDGLEHAVGQLRAALEAVLAVGRDVDGGARLAMRVLYWMAVGGAFAGAVTGNAAAAFWAIIAACVLTMRGRRRSRTVT